MNSFKLNNIFNIGIRNRIRGWWLLDKNKVDVLATCISSDGKPNIITLGMYMPISSNPPLITIGVSPRRYSYKLIEETKEFAINVPSKDLVEQTVFCGRVSGRD